MPPQVASDQDFIVPRMNVPRMKLLTLTQPWATLVAIGAKRIETRGWKTPYRGPIAIHAAKGLNGLGHRATIADLDYLIAREPFAGALGYRPACELPRGCIVAVADLDLVTPTPLDDETRVDYDRNEWSFGDYSPDRYAWLLENVRPLDEPVECRGERGLPDLNPDIARIVRAQLAR